MSSIRLRSILITLIIAVTIIAFGISAGIIFVQKKMQASIEANLHVVASITEELVSEEIKLLKSNAAVLAMSILESGEENPGEFLWRQAAPYPAFKGVSVFDARTGRIASAGEAPAPESILNETFVQRTFEGDHLLSSPLKDAEGRVWLYAAVPLPEKGRILVVTIPGMYFSDLLKNFTVWETGHIFINDAEGYVVANPRSEWVENRYNFIKMAETDSQYAGLAGVVTQMTWGETGVSRFSLEGVPRLCAYRPVSGSLMGWSLGVVAPEAESPVRNIDDSLILTGLVCIALSIVAAFIIASFMEKPYLTISKMLPEMDYRGALLHTINDTAAVLLRSDTASFSKSLHACMRMMAGCIKADRMRIFRNYTWEDEPYCTLIYEWVKDNPLPEGKLNSINVSYNREAPDWYAKLSMGQCINSRVKDFQKAERSLLAPYKILSIMVLPMFFGESFWGIVTFDDCIRERVFEPVEEGIMRSGALLVVNALQRNEMDKDLIRAQEIAEAASLAKSTFLANMSHEMRTPLNAVIGLSELTLDNELPAEARENISKVYTSGVILLGIVNDILDLSKIQSGKFELAPVEYDVPSLINDTVSLNSIRTGSKPIKFNLHLDGSLPVKLYGDDLRIKQIFNNLLSNAFKYTREGSVDWTVSCRREAESVWLTGEVRDTGHGIKAEDIDKLFSDYGQVDTKSNRAIEGTGLGLSITKKMIEMMGGTITVESEYGKGSAFTVRIRQKYVNDRTIGDDVARNLMAFRYVDSKRTRNDRMVRLSLPYARVLVVDDVAANLAVARGILKRYGMKVDCVASGPEAIDLIKNAGVKYNAVFMDHMMPGMDGIEAARIIREEIGTEYARNIPIIALTANAIIGSEKMFIESGFQDFLSKPIDIMGMDAVVRRWVRGRSQEDAQGLPAEVPAEVPVEISAEEKAEPGQSPVFAGTEIEGLNYADGLRRLGGSEEIYLDVLESYERNIPPLIQALKDLKQENLESYRIAVHGLKGSSLNIGAESLGEKARDMEKAARDGDFDYVKDHNDEFLAEAEKLLQNISAFTGKNRLKMKGNKPYNP